jgi:opacity protein-like surface antigen
MLVKRLAMTGLVVLLAGAAVRPAEAQARFGAQLSWAEDTDLGIGARLGFPLGGELKRKGIEGLATFDYFFPDGFDFWEITANGLYHFTQGSSAKPYVGAGVIFGRYSGGTPGSDDSDFGLNLIGGLRFKAQERLLPFIEGRFEVKDGTQFVLSAGVYFGKP